MLEKICVYCGSSPGKRTYYRDGARKLAKLFVQKDIELVYGGASVGVMGALADGVLEAGGRVTGIIPEDLVRKEVAHNKLTDLHVVASMHERKAQMADLSDAFIALPGGLGTLEELFEIVTWSQLGLHRKPIGLINVSGYYDQLASFLDHAVAEQFVKIEHRNLLMIEKDPEELISNFENYKAPDTEKWISSDST
ncbi:TIGR00730 family Rossman fold protein [Fodinibius sediminis]|uniref:Cytokinin riboside 5'-monophosphate phosphoribohydrolase n=1 Tax=Fodinibius sediminis TaxID=1214077 RepID=A0A521CA15_9BACT|nr:TIGR00730 family Rossman fold protein [Fodinibius sediminis]SMO55651.1 hypothetical protein SAMN06265218_105150 [Fodinibius sediminis]